MSLRQEMARYLAMNPGQSDKALSVGFLRVHTKRDLIPLLEEEFQHMRRGRTREVEMMALMGAGPPARKPVTHKYIQQVLKGEKALPGLTLPSLKIICQEEYALGDGRRKRGRDMTSEDWATRRIMLQQQQAGIERSIEICDRMENILKMVGVKTGGELIDMKIENGDGDDEEEQAA